VGKKILDTKDSHLKKVTAVRSRISQYVRSLSLPFPEPGIRLIRQDQVEPFTEQLNHFQADLQEAVTELDAVYSELREDARERLGELYNPDDYPNSLLGMFQVHWEFPSVEPPSYLAQLNPELYQQEVQRVQARFDEAVRLAEEAFTEELAKLVSHLTERLAGSEDGRPQIFRDSAVENLHEFFERFRLLNIGSNEQLEQLVSQCQQIVQGVEPQQLRERVDLRQHVATELSAVGSVLDGLLVDRPRRNIIRNPK
jgi:hypothetical protein